MRKTVFTRKAVLTALVAVTILLIGAPPSQAWQGGGHGGGWHGGGWHGGGWHGGWHGRVFVGVGPYWGWGPYPYPYYWGYYPPPVAYSPPVVVQQEPPVYVTQPQPPPASPPAPASPQAFWYYCASAQAYFPNVQSCPEAWIKVPPTPE